jgi:hypothetical protein
MNPMRFTLKQMFAAVTIAAWLIGWPIAYWRLGVAYERLNHHLEIVNNKVGWLGDQKRVMVVGGRQGFETFGEAAAATLLGGGDGIYVNADVPAKGNNAYVNCSGDALLIDNDNDDQLVMLEGSIDGPRRQQARPMPIDQSSFMGISAGDK